MGPRRALTLSVTCAAALWSAGIHAQTKPEISPKEQLDICIASFEEAQLKQKRGKLVFARKLFNDCASNACPRQLREDCAQHQDKIDKAIPTVVIVVRDANGKDVEATLKVDGAPFATEAGRGQPMDPGAHEVQYTLAGRSPLTSKITIYEGEKSRLVVLDADNRGAPATSPPAAPASSNDHGKASPDTGPLVGPILLGGVGALFIVGGAIAFFVASGEASERDDQLRAARLAPESERGAYEASADSHDRAASSNQALGVVGGTVGVLAVAGAVAWYLVGRPSKAAATLSPRPAVGPTTAGASMSFSF